MPSVSIFESNESKDKSQQVTNDDSTSESSDEVVFRSGGVTGPRDGVEDQRNGTGLGPNGIIHMGQIKPDSYEENKRNSTLKKKPHITTQEGHKPLETRNGWPVAGVWQNGGSTEHQPLFKKEQKQNNNNVLTTIKERRSGTIKPKGAALDDAEDELKRLQEEAITKLGNKRLGISTDDDGPTSLHLAREGPGIDPSSEIWRKLMLMVSGAKKLPAIQGEAPHMLIGEGNEGDNVIPYPKFPDEEPGSQDNSDCQSMNTVHMEAENERNDHLNLAIQNFQANNQETGDEQPSPEEVAAGGEPSPLKSGHETALQFSAQLVDWQYRPWHTYRDPSFLKRFRHWLETTMRLGFRIDVNDPKFQDGNSHANGIDGFDYFELEDMSTNLNFDDPENRIHAHETALGFIYNWNARLLSTKRKEDEQKDRERKAIKQATTPTSPLRIQESNPNTPKVNVYLRPAETRDAPALISIINWHISNTVRCVDLFPLSTQEMVDRIDDCQREQLPFIVAAQRKPSRRDMVNGNSEAIWGFACATDFTGQQSSNRYTVELEAFVHPEKKQNRIGRCLMDKILEVCDSSYSAKRGYFFDCFTTQRPRYSAGGNRTLARLIAIIHHPASDPSEYRWIKDWLIREFKFEEQGLLKGTGFNKDQL